jgi:hypothetical protein
MRYQRPGAVKAAAIMCIIYGSIFTLLGLCGVIGLLVQDMLFGNGPEAVVQKHVDDVREQEVPAYRYYMATSLVLGLAESLTILISGIFLFRLSRGARIGAILGASVGITSSILGSLYYFTYVYPATREAFRQMPVVLAKNNHVLPPGDLDDMELMTFVIDIGAVVFSLLVTIPLIIIILLLTRRHVVSAFKNPVPADDYLRYDDERDYDYTGREYDDRDRDYDDRRYDDRGDERGPADDRFR